MRRCCLETTRLWSQLASSFHCGRPSSPPPVSHTAANVLECFRTHNAHVADRDVVLFNDPKCSRASSLAYFFSFTLSSTKKHPPFKCKRTFPHAPAHTAIIIYVLSNVHMRTLTQTSSTNTRTNGAVIKNKTMGFLKAPRTEGKSQQQRSGEKSPPGNNEENDHLLFLKSR